MRKRAANGRRARPCHQDVMARTGRSQGCPATIGHMPIDRPAKIPAMRTAERAFIKGRATALKRLVRIGVPIAQAEAWVNAWDATTAGLLDFRRADDFWLLGYRYAREEYARGFAPPVMEPGGARPGELRDVRDEQAHAS